MHKKLIIIGAGGHGKVAADIAIQMQQWDEIAFLDDRTDLKSVMGVEVIGSLDEIHKYIDCYDFFVSIGNNKRRSELQYSLQKKGANLATLIHPSCVIGKNVTIGSGSVIMPGAIINCCTNIGKGCIINTGATIDHDSVLSDYVHVSPGTHLAGTVIIGSNCWLGIGSIVNNNVQIVNDCIIGAGTVVIKNIEEPGVYVGVPARRV